MDVLRRRPAGCLRAARRRAALVIYSIVVMALFSGMRSILELILVSYVVLAWVGLVAPLY